MLVRQVLKNKVQVMVIMKKHLAKYPKKLFLIKKIMILSKFLKIINLYIINNQKL
jgi:hypothetical protein